MSISPRGFGKEEAEALLTRASTHATGERVTEPQPGQLECVECGYVVSPQVTERIPECPACGASTFRRSRLFERDTAAVPAVAPAQSEPAAVRAARAELPPGYHLVWEDLDGELMSFSLQPGWARVGRSSAADVRLDDATVSRRHALIVLTDDDEVRALDDRSLNGLFVNGQRVDWKRLEDGDELEIGCFRVYLVHVG